MTDRPHLPAMLEGKDGARIRYCAACGLVHGTPGWSKACPGHPPGRKPKANLAPMLAGINATCTTSRREGFRRQMMRTSDPHTLRRVH